jgi:hypothetical protein
MAKLGTAQFSDQLGTAVEFQDLRIVRLRHVQREWDFHQLLSSCYVGFGNNASIAGGAIIKQTETLVTRTALGRKPSVESAFRLLIHRSRTLPRLRGHGLQSPDTNTRRATSSVSPRQAAAEGGGGRLAVGFLLFPRPI